MARRLRPPRPTLTVAAAALAVMGAVPASAAEGWTCWSGRAVDGNGQTSTVTRCRLGGSTGTADYGSSTEVPARLRPQVGDAGDGPCWYWSTGSSDWVVLGVDGTRATLGIDPDGAPGGPVIISAEYPACTSEPSATGSVLAEAYELLRTYRHPLPDPAIDPPVGAGISGLGTFVRLVAPDPWSASLVSPATGVRIDVETRVSAITLDWGDGEVTTVPEDAFALLSGWPDGAFGHTYETKTCSPPEGERCHPSLSAYPLTIRFVWAARYRVDGDPWTPLPVPTTETTVDYDVDEIRGFTTGVG